MCFVVFHTICTLSGIDVSGWSVLWPLEECESRECIPVRLQCTRASSADFLSYSRIHTHVVNEWVQKRVLETKWSSSSWCWFSVRYVYGIRCVILFFIYSSLICTRDNKTRKQTARRCKQDDGLQTLLENLGKKNAKKMCTDEETYTHRERERRNGIRRPTVFGAG